MGKGSEPRPMAVDRETFDVNWDRIFSSKEESMPWDHYSDLPAPEYYQQKESDKCNG
jgi:hypothetical protein